MRLSKEVGILALSSLLIASLVIYLILSLQAVTTKQKRIPILESRLTGLIKKVEDNLIPKGEGKTIDTQNNVVASVQAIHVILNDLYEGKLVLKEDLGDDIRFEKPESEERKLHLKQTLVAVLKLQDLLKTGDETAMAQVGTVNVLIQNILKNYKKEARQSIKNNVYLVWISIGLIILFVVALTIIAWAQLKKNAQQIFDSKRKMDLESTKMKQFSEFIEAMTSGNYNIEIKSDSTDDLSATLITMRDKLKNNAEEEKRRGWANTGLAKIGEVLRDTTNAIALYDNVIKFLVKYTNSNQGGLFILNDDDAQNSSLDLLACYAYERKKFLSKRIEPGQGLVGQCFLEQERIHLTEVPDEYIRITSGLGGEKPQSLLLMPLKVNDKVFGVLELASFNYYPEHVVELVAKFAENIASTISNVKINESTRVLLEQTQQQAEEMKAQEEEMRQNMEELSATQEEMHRKEREYISRIQQLEAQASVAERI